VGYLVKDDTSATVFRSLERHIGFDPDAILACDRKTIARAIEAGGMLPEHRAEKVRACARICKEVGGPRVLRDAGERTLERFPGFGKPGADRVLLWTHRKRTLAPDSNALRVMYRLGWIEEEANYSQKYRAATEWTLPKLPESFREIVSLHHLLRVHGQSTCKRKKPACRACPLLLGCNQRGLND
jgi:endonuclease-3